MSAVALLLSVLLPAAGGALAQHLWTTRPRAAAHTGLAVGQIPHQPRRRAQAVRRAARA